MSAYDLQIFSDYIHNQKSAPDKISLNKFDINRQDNDFVISRDISGNIISKFGDNKWNFEPYISNPSQYPICDFEKSVYKNYIDDAKKLLLLLMIYGHGRDGSHYSVSTITGYFVSAIIPISKFAKKLNVSFYQIFEETNYTLQYINEECTNRTKISTILSLLFFLNSHSNDKTKINYKQDSNVIFQANKLRTFFLNQTKQTEIIPIRIFSESLSQRWKQIEEVEQYLNNLNRFFKQYIKSQFFAIGETNVIRNKSAIGFESAVKKFQLEELFKKYNIKNRQTFLAFITKLQGTCNHLIHAYTGMRRGEVLNLKSNCIEKIDTSSGTCYLIGISSKLSGRNEDAKWVTSKEIIRVINILNSFNNIVAKQFNANLTELPLFLSFISILGKTPKIEVKKKFSKNEELSLNYSKLTITQSDKEEIDKLNFNSNIDSIDIGDTWSFKTHQYRRSLAVHSINSGFVSLGTLQIQLKHLFREMTLYYANGASFARKLFDVPKEHIANDFEILKPEIDALTYIHEVLFSNENLFGIYGKFVEQNFKSNNKENLANFILKNKDKTIKQFKNGDISYKETALGGCIATEACDSRLTRSVTACLECHGAVLKKSKIDNVIQNQKIFIESLDINSIEYNTEISDLKTLEEISAKLIKE